MADAEAVNFPARILVVDDYEPWRRHLRSTLDSIELRIIGEVSDGLEAVRIAEELKPNLILLDIDLPNLNGIEVERRLCQLVPSAKTLFLSQNDAAELVQAALSNGARGYVFKADAGSELLPAIQAVLRGERFVSSGVKQ